MYAHSRAETAACQGEADHLLQCCSTPSMDTAGEGLLQHNENLQEAAKHDKLVIGTGQEDTNRRDCEHDIIEEKKITDGGKELFKLYDCKPDPSFWDFVPDPVTKRLTQLRSWFWGDMCKTHLIWIKLIFFFQSASLVVLYPYLVIHMRSLGLSVEEVAVVNGVIPVADIVGPPLAGLVADKIGNFRLFMSGLTAVSGAASLLLLLIPTKSTQTILSPDHLYCCTEPGSLSRTLCTDSQTNISYLGEYTLMGTTANQSTTLWTNTANQSTVTCSASNGEFLYSHLKQHKNESEAFTEQCKIFECAGKIETVDENWELNLVFYIVLRAMIDVLRASSCMMFEGAVVITIKQMGGDYGLQKLFGTFGAIIWGPVSGQIIDMASSASGAPNYAPVFYTFFVMRIICALLILKLNLSFKKPAKRVFKDLGKLIIKPHIFMFLVIFFLCGSVWGFLESYLFWFLEDLGSTKLMMGISLAIGTIAGIPLTIGSGAIIRILGNANVIVLALALYSLRLLGYSFINVPMESLVFEIFKPFGNSLLMIAAMTYAKNNSDITTMASLEGVMGALYFGIGKALGSLIGGLSIDTIGVRNTFRCFSVVSLVAGSIYLLFTLLWEKRKKHKTGPDVEQSSDNVCDDTKTDDADEKVVSKDTNICKPNIATDKVIAETSNDSRST